MTKTNKHIKKTVQVEYVIPTIECIVTGTLEYGNGFFPKLTINDNVERSLPKQIERLTCESECESYTLFSCEYKHGSYYPSFVIEGQIDAAINGIEIILSDFSEWINQGTHFELSEEKIKKELNKLHIDQMISYENNSYKITTRNYVSAKETTKNKTLITELTKLCVHKIDNEFTIQEAVNLAHELRKLFSLLLWVPQHIDSIYVVCSNRPQMLSSWMFSSPDDANKKFSEFIINPCFIFKHNLWEKIFTSFFTGESKRRFSSYWSRVVGLLSYNDLWEYELLGYVSLIDAFSSSFVKNPNEKLDDIIFEDLKCEVILAITKFRDAQSDDIKRNVVFDSLLNGTRKMRNTRVLDFVERFESLLDDCHIISKNIKAMIGLESKDIRVLKKIRDKSAHGTSFKKKGADLTYENTILLKLVVLIMYFIYRDFGISERLFAQSVCDSFNKYIRGAKIDEYSRDMIIGETKTFSATKETIALAKQHQCLYIGFIKDPKSNSVVYDSEITSLIHSAWMNGKSKQHIVDFLKSALHLSKESLIHYFNKAYLIDGVIHQDITGMCLIESPLTIVEPDGAVVS